MLNREEIRGKLIETLESRVMFSADAIPISPTQPTRATTDVILIDSQLKNSETLVAAALAGSHVIEYNGIVDSAHDVLQHVMDWGKFSGSRIRSLSILSHGAAGGFELGDQWITEGSLAGHASEWRALSPYLMVGATIDIYGCNVAATADGKMLVNDLATYTGGQVFASNNVTGVGGDWKLEVSSSGSTPASGMAAPLNIATLESSGATLAWYNTNWNYRQQITVDHTKVTGSSDLSGFPVLVDLGTDSGLAAHALSNGNDILFTSSDGTTKLAHEISVFTASNGHLVAWVNVPTLSVSADTVLYMYYGNAAASNQQNATGVWDANTLAVYHLEQSANPYLDSTGNTNNSSGGVDPTASTGKSGGGQTFDGTSTTIIIPDSSTLDPGLSLTTSMWFKLNARGQADLLEKGGNAGYTLWLNDNIIWFGSQNSSVDRWAVGTTALSIGVWYAIDGVNDNGIKSLYINGVLDGISTGSDAPSNTGALQIGNGIDGHVDGALDELRLANAARSADWIHTQYNSQSSPTTFYSVAGEAIFNHAPVGTSNTVTTSEDTPYAFTAADFGFTDPNDTPANALAAVKITTLPSAGTITLSGVPVIAGQFVSVTNINAGNLTFIPVPDGNGAPYASFTFQVKDDGGTANGAVDLDPTPRTLTLDVTAVNDAPTITNSSTVSLASTNEDTTSSGTSVNSILTGAGWADVDSGPLKGLAITSKTGNGAWQFSTDGTTWNGFGSVSSTNALLLTSSTQVRYLPAGLGGETASFGFVAWDQTSGTAGSTADVTTNGGATAFSSATASSNLTVAAVDDPPTATNLSASETYTEDTPLNLTHIVVSDVDSANVTVTLTLSNVVAGNLNMATSGVVTSTYNAGTGIWSASGAIADVNTLLAGLTFTPAANSNGNFTIATSVSDGVAVAVTGSKSMTGTAVNDPPIRTVGTVRNLTVLEESGLTSMGLGSLTYGAGGGSDEAGQSLTYKITVVPSAALGSIMLADGATVVTVNTTYSLAQLQGMKFETAAHASGGPAKFAWIVRDNGGTTFGGVDTLSESLTITVTAKPRPRHERQCPCCMRRWHAFGVCTGRADQR